MNVAPGRALRRVLLWVVAGVLGALVLVAGLAALRLRSVASDLREARRLLEQAGDRLQDADLAGARTDLAAAQSLLLSANDRLYAAPELSVLSVLPVASDNLTAIRRAVGTALAVTTSGNRLLAVSAALEAPDGRLEVPLAGGAIPLDVVEAAQAELASLAVAFPAPGVEPSAARLLPPIADAQRELDDALDRRRPQVVNLAQGLALLHELAGGNGDRRYLIAVANTAEMRATGGMILSYGVLESTEGMFSLPAFGGIDELLLASPVPTIDIPADEAARWEGFQPDRLWRSVNLVPDLAVAADRMRSLYEAATGLPVDGVLQIDAHGLAAMLAGIGPVDVPGVGTVTDANVVALTLNEAYALFPDRDQRQEVLGDVAEAVFDRLVTGDYQSLRPLATALATAAAERHIALWSDRVQASGPAAFFAADASLPDPAAEHALLTVQNLGRDKLDYYVDTDIAVTGSRPAGEQGRLDVAITVANGAPPGATEPLYVFGDPATGRDAPIGTYVGVVSLYVPSGTVLAAGAETARLVPEGGRTAITFDVAVPPGAAVTTTFALELPPRAPGAYELAIVPVPRVRPTTWAVRIDTGDAVVERAGPLLRAEILASAR